ncbi:MAG: YihY family inner membrane protein [Desulfovibrionaceae bacterium]|nr:YihY family inner membrane protein [Desulfovibrionaceae bacterium]
MIPSMNTGRLQARLKTFITGVTDFPVLPTAATLRERFRQDRLSMTASALTFTTVLALVPLFAVVLSVFTAFPIFARLRDALEHWLIDSLIPAGIASHVMGYLNQFATKASGLGAAGLAALLFTAISLMLTIDHTLNAIWRVSAPRPLGQRILVYWAALTLGPLVLGASLAITSYVLTASRGWLPGIGGGANLLLGAAQFLLMTLGLTLLYRFVPHTPVKYKHALAGALFVAAGLGLAKWGLGFYLSRVPGYSLIYGTFATVPILLLWIYLSWLIVLLGAVIAAYLPTLLSGVARRGGGPGWDFQLAVEVLQALAQAQGTPARGLTLPQLAARLQVDALQLSPALEALRELDWVGQLGGMQIDDPRRVLLLQPERQSLRPLMEKLLLKPDPALARWWAADALNRMTVASVLPPGGTMPDVEPAAGTRGGRRAFSQNRLEGRRLD